MLNLEQDAVTGWLKAVQPARTEADWPPPVRPIELQGDAPALLERLGSAIAQCSARELDAARLTDETILSPLRDVLAQLGAARMLRIVTDLRDLVPGEIELAWPDTPAGRALEAATTATARTTLRGRLISQERIDALARALEPTPKETP